MEKYICQDLVIRITRAELLKTIRIVDDPSDEDCQRATAMLAEALDCCRPKYVYCIAAINSKEDHAVVVEGHRFVSALIRQNLDRVHRIVPYVATCGTEIDLWSRQYTDMMENFWADEIKKMILAKCMSAMKGTIRKQLFPAMDMSSMSPGSLPAWPVTEQATLFQLIGDVEQDVGVKLTDSFLMIPSKSVSGFFFSSEIHYENCRLCPMKNCPNRTVDHHII